MAVLVVQPLLTLGQPVPPAADTMHSIDRRTSWSRRTATYSLRMDMARGRMHELLNSTAVGVIPLPSKAERLLNGKKSSECARRRQRAVGTELECYRRPALIRGIVTVVHGETKPLYFNRNSALGEYAVVSGEIVATLLPCFVPESAQSSP